MFMLQVVMVNSSWTRRHIRQLWWKLEDPKRVYPPCNTKVLQALPLQRRLKRLYLVSVAQFRPEKDHGLQLDSLALARKTALQDCGGQCMPTPLRCLHQMAKTVILPTYLNLTRWNVLSSPERFYMQESPIHRLQRVCISKCNVLSLSEHKYAC